MNTKVSTSANPLVGREKLIIGAGILFASFLSFVSAPSVVADGIRQFAPNIPTSASIFGVGSAAGKIVDFLNAMPGDSAGQRDSIVNQIRLVYLLYFIPFGAIWLCWTELRKTGRELYGILLGFVGILPALILIYGWIAGWFMSPNGRSSISPFSIIDIGFYIITSLSMWLLFVSFRKRQGNQ